MCRVMRHDGFYCPDNLSLACKLVAEHILLRGVILNCSCSGCGWRRYRYRCRCIAAVVCNTTDSSRARVCRGAGAGGREVVGAGLFTQLSSDCDSCFTRAIPIVFRLCLAPLAWDMRACRPMLPSSLEVPHRMQRNFVLLVTSLPTQLEKTGSCSHSALNCVCLLIMIQCHTGCIASGIIKQIEHLSRFSTWNEKKKDYGIMVQKLVSSFLPEHRVSSGTDVRTNR